MVNPTESSPATNEPVLQEVSPHQQASTDQPDIQEIALHQSAPHQHKASMKQEAKKKGKLVKDPYSDIGKKRQNINKEENIDEDANRALQRSLDGLKTQVGEAVNNNVNKTVNGTVGKPVNSTENQAINASETKTEKLLKDPYLFIGSASEERRRSSVQTKRSFDPYADLGTSIGLTQNEAHDKSKKAAKSEAKTITSESSGNNQQPPLSGIARSLDEHASEAKKIGDEVGAFTSASQSHIGPHDTSDPYNDLKSLKDVDPKKDEKESTKQVEEHKDLLSSSATTMKTGEMEKAFQVTNSVAKELKTIANIEREIASEKSLSLIHI